MDSYWLPVNNKKQTNDNDMAEDFHDAPSHSNLPAPITSFWGRKDTCEKLAQMIVNPASRLVTLVGEGGVGKTRLALETAVHVQKHFHHGVWYVPLINLAAKSSNAIVTAVSAALGLTLNNKQPLKKQLFTFLKERRLLLTLDNFEHLIDHAYLVVELLHHAPQVAILCTSREPLQLQAEYVFSISGLSCLEPHGTPHENTSTVETILAERWADGINLFIDRAKQTGTDFEATAVNLPQIIQICQLVMGNPLGIELAAAAIRYHSLAEILAAIPSSLDFLSTHQRDVSPRHQSMRAVFTGSWELLLPREQQILARLSVFRDSFTSEAAQSVTGALWIDLEKLRDKSLVQKKARNRYAIHALWRQFARERLETAVTTDQNHNLATVQKRHNNYSLNLVAECEGAFSNR